MTTLRWLIKISIRGFREINRLEMALERRNLVNRGPSRKSKGHQIVGVNWKQWRARLMALMYRRISGTQRLKARRMQAKRARIHKEGRMRQDLSRISASLMIKCSNLVLKNLLRVAPLPQLLPSTTFSLSNSSLSSTQASNPNPFSKCRI